MARKNKVHIPVIYVLRVIAWFFLAFLVFSTYIKVKGFFLTSPIFAVREVMVDASIQFIDMRELRKLKGKNIFHIDLDQLAKKINSRYPQIAQLRIVREFPDRIKVLAKKRFAFLQLAIRGKYLVLDHEGVVMYFTRQPAPHLTVLKDVGELINITMGAPVQARGVNVALEVLRAIKNHPRLSRLEIVFLDVSNLSRIEAHLSNHFRIIIDQENVADKIDMLAVLLSGNKIDFNQVQYIDLRFKEPVLGEKGR